VSFEVTHNSNPDLFSAGPAVSSDGELTYTPAADKNGSATIKIRGQDDGGTANNGVNQSAEQPFTISVNAVNDSPGATDDNTASMDVDGDPLQIDLRSWSPISRPKTRTSPTP
jgi:hypothetical protein